MVIQFKKGDRVVHPELGKGKFERFMMNPIKALCEFSSNKKADSFYSLTPVVVADLAPLQKGAKELFSIAIHKGFDLFDEKQISLPFDPSLYLEEDVKLFREYSIKHGRIVITCSSSAGLKTAEDVAKVLGISTIEAAQYVACFTDASHGAKYDVVVPNSLTIAGIDHKLNLYFNVNGNMCQKGLEVQIGSKSLSEYLMRNGMLPEVAAAGRRPLTV